MRVEAELCLDPARSIIRAKPAVVRSALKIGEAHKIVI
jgi:hypothetical protein